MHRLANLITLATLLRQVANRKTTAATIKANLPDLFVYACGAVGQGLNNQFELYRQKISSMTTVATGLVGIAPAVSQATKKSSLY